MLRQELPDRAHAFDRSIFEATVGERALHRPADRIPCILGYASIDSSIGDDFDVAVGKQHVDQHAVVVLGIPDAELTEELERTRTRLEAPKHLRERKRSFDDEAKLSLVRSLSSGDRILYPLQRVGREPAPCA